MLDVRNQGPKPVEAKAVLAELSAGYYSVAQLDALCGEDVECRLGEIASGIAHVLSEQPGMSGRTLDAMEQEQLCLMLQGLAVDLREKWNAEENSETNPTPGTEAAGAAVTRDILEGARPIISFLNRC